jgi:hypothetical protein
MIPEPVRRRDATNATIERYKGKAFDWGKGVTCVHLTRAHLRNMGRRPPSVPRFRSALAAKRAMAERGWSDVPEMLDSLLPRIAPAQAVLGDVMALEGEGGMGAICICAGPRRAFGWFEGEEKPVMVEPDMAKVIGAWRV